MLGAFDATRLGHNLTGWIGTDGSGYQFGPEMLSATDAGKWLTCVYRNPEIGNITSEDFGDAELKNVWVVRHDGLLFASGWYISVEDFIQTLVADMTDAFDPSAGSSSGIEHLIGPGAVASGLSSTVEYYNNTEGRGQSLAFVADSEGQIVSAFLNPELNATSIVDTLGPAVLDATADGVWITEADNEPDTGARSMRVWVVHSDGHYFGAGWHATSEN